MAAYKDDNPEISLGTGAAEKTKQKSIKRKEETRRLLHDAKRALGLPINEVNADKKYNSKYGSGK